MGITLTVFFDDPFWVGLFQRREGERMTAVKVVFGAEPRDEQVLQYILDAYWALSFSPPVSAGNERPLAANPKRRQRQAAKLQEQGTSTKAQQALQLAREETKQQRQAASKARREDEMERKLLLHIQKKKAKHRGH